MSRRREATLSKGVARDAGERTVDGREGGIVAMGGVGGIEAVVAEALVLGDGCQRSAGAQLLSCGGGEATRAAARLFALFLFRLRRRSGTENLFVSGTCMLKKEFYNKTPSHNTGHGTGAHWH